LRKRGWIADDEQVIRCEKPGEGNMNLTLRVTTERPSSITPEQPGSITTDQRSLIVKQARPWVEKYDHIPAPWDRIEYECRFYQRVNSIPLVAAQMPRLLHVDTKAHTLALQDLGDARPLISLYAGEVLDEEEVQYLAKYLGSLHSATQGPADPSFENREMRQLNHQHIFEIPLEKNNGIDLELLESGLSVSVTNLRENTTYRERVMHAGERYLKTRSVLVHGDYFPGSWLRTTEGIFIIDPEFCFYGDPEFDLGCAIAHFRLARQPRQHAQAFLQSYIECRKGIAIESSLLASFAAVEVMRRLIGVAQLPLPASKVRRAELLDRSSFAMIDHRWEELWDED